MIWSILLIFENPTFTLLMFAFIFLDIYLIFYFFLLVLVSVCLTMVLERTPNSSLDCKIKLVNPKGNQA